ncbi:glycerol kinase GlpK [Acanthopleuribacter pedis]|uniref:Glycerol kinase n=1 Tax=Acanthopleuribacter pedis TaxID=442870 RepID=A0A8J7U2P0_9BACT|nr:glycerol kinase GlpK [Acanthopleuribacter pedis]MBO1317924.1 glycerol kinase GlpK [Acanthopleuribacter pedis]
MSELILAIDQGTTSSRAILFDRQGGIRGMAQQEFPQIFPADGWVEHNPEDLIQSTRAVCHGALDAAGVDAARIAAVGITNQRETTLVWDRLTGKPIYNAIVWQDRRTAEYCRRLKQQGHEAMVRRKTGLLLDPYFSATKLRWILRNQPDASQAAAAGGLCFGTVDTWLLWHLSKGRRHATDATNASRTLLYDIHQGAWDDELLSLFEIPRGILPEVCDSAADFGTCDFLGREIPIFAIAGDQQAATIGQACFKPGMVKSTYGTGCFMVLNTGDKVVESQHRLLGTVAYQLDGRRTYALEGSIFVAGAAIQWLRDALKVIDTAAASEAPASALSDNHGVYFVPAFTGLGAPYWNPDARGAVLGLTRDAGADHLVRAALEAVCYQTRDLTDAMAGDGIHARELRVDGGMVANSWMCQFLADTLDMTVKRPHVRETTALGVAFLCGLKLGWYQSLDEIAALWGEERAFEAGMAGEQRQRNYAGWRKAVARVNQIMD